MWLKSITIAHRAAGQPVGQRLRALDVPAQPVEVQRLGPQLDAVVVRPVGRADEFGGDQVEIFLQRTQRSMIQGTARQHQRAGAGGGGEGQQRFEMPVPLGAAGASPAAG